jgi:hypothetical protein
LTATTYSRGETSVAARRPAIRSIDRAPPQCADEVVALPVSLFWGRFGSQGPLIAAAATDKDLTMTKHDSKPARTRIHPDEMPFAESIDMQAQYPEEGWEYDTIGSDPVALSILDTLDHWRRNQDSDAAIELLERAISTVRWYQGTPPTRARGTPTDVTPTSSAKDAM